MKEKAFSLSKAGLHNLKAICQEFERCSKSYPPLFHQRMVPWSEKGRVGITLSQWKVFMGVEANALDDALWWQWDHPQENNDYLGQWFGDPDGMEEFANLSESVAMVLLREPSDFDPLDFSLDVSGGADWIRLLHEWAFKYQMPLLRSDMSLWGVEDYEIEEFYDLAEQWNKHDDSGKAPRHPVVWRLIDNVFTSSMSALRALLWPDAVIATNEPWLISMREEEATSFSGGDKSQEIEAPQQHGTNCHQLNFDGLHWRILSADGEDDFLLRNFVGVRHIALLLESPNERYTPMVMARNNGARPSRMGAAYTGLSSNEQSDCASNLSVRDSLDWGEDVIDRECDDELRAEFKRLRAKLQDARELQNVEDIAKLEHDFLILTKQFRMDHDGKGRIRLFQKSHWERSRKNVANALTRAIEDVRGKSSAIADQLDAQIDRQGGFAYRPIDSLPTWSVLKSS